MWANKRKSTSKVWMATTNFCKHSSRAANARCTMSANTGKTTHSLVDFARAFPAADVWRCWPLVVATPISLLSVLHSELSLTHLLTKLAPTSVCLCHRSPQPSACLCMQFNCWLVDESLLHCLQNVGQRHVGGGRWVVRMWQMLAAQSSEKIKPGKREWVIKFSSTMWFALYKYDSDLHLRQDKLFSLHYAVGIAPIVTIYPRRLSFFYAHEVPPPPFFTFDGARQQNECFCSKSKNFKCISQKKKN